jgi:hypothetical protein
MSASLIGRLGSSAFRLRQRLDLIGHGFNSLIDSSKISDNAYHAWRKNIRSLGQNVGQLLAKETQSLPDDEFRAPEESHESD